MRYWTNETVNLDGSKSSTKIPWAKEDYEQKILDLEAEITLRRLRESVLTQQGAEWLQAKELEIEIYRSELNDLSIRIN